MPDWMRITRIRPKDLRGQLFASEFGLAVPHELDIRPEAEAELADAYAWHEERVEGLGDQFLLTVDAALQAIVRAPHQYPQVFKTIRRCAPSVSLSRALRRGQFEGYGSCGVPREAGPETMEEERMTSEPGDAADGSRLHFGPWKADAEVSENLPVRAVERARGSLGLLNAAQAVHERMDR